ncbi:MAG: PEGA domain-containing protein [Ignavibacteriales bacterium]|jgi:hypothetical protein|nr:PEGA domain-containing protein [Ignavibacteriaceae bacterium]NLH60124.1 PEGA domain-containing protein [Ignavibacteriales bacterium]HOJ18593.1 PEGA domain-containing protein [Ignavibacteriaceae bacterium]HPO55452.1 PEGA domain-containing protein [Ignavibacteriaceae bacterium]
MKKLLILPLLFAISMLFVSCEDTATDPIVTVVKGSVYVQSTPVGAQIWVNNTNTGKVTPDTVANLDSGNVAITLKLAGFVDSTVTVNILPNQVRQLAVTLTQVLNAVKYGPVKIWETSGTTAAQPSGLVLSSGNAYGISGTSKDSVDIYYSSTGWLVKSAHLTSLPRTAYFKAAGAGIININDGVASSTQDASWGDNMIDRNTNGYYFIKTHDGNYVKIVVSAFGGGTAGNPAWVEVTWWYNKTVGDKRFPTN